MISPCRYYQVCVFFQPYIFLFFSEDICPQGSSGDMLRPNLFCRIASRKIEVKLYLDRIFS